MTKEQKQLVLVAVLSITLYAVWPSGRQAEHDTPIANTAANTAAASEASFAKHPESPDHLVSGQENAARLHTFRQRWSIDEILTMGPRERWPSPEGDTNASRASHAGAIQAVYFTSSSTQSDASAIIGGQVVKRGQTLPGNRVVGEIHWRGVAIESAD